MAAKKKNTSRKNVNHPTVEVSVVGNQNAIGMYGGRATVSISQAAQEDWKAWQKKMEREIKALKELTAEDHAMLTHNVEEVVKEAEQGEKADPSRIERLLNTLSAMAPDILDVVVATIKNPLAGIGLVIKKIGEKAKVSKVG
jgi:hypothetical protein